MKDLCFVLMPFGRKPDSAGGQIDFDAVYAQVFAPGIAAAGLEPIRADEEMSGGIIHRPMFERLIFCKYAVADLTAANANVFYELGIRHAIRGWSTVLLFAAGRGQLPFDVALLRGLPYHLSPDGKPLDAAAASKALTGRLLEAKASAASKPAIDSPLFQLVDGYPEIDHTRTDIFRAQVEYSISLKSKLAEARRQGADAVAAVEREVGALDEVDSGVVIDLLLSHRAVKSWPAMISLVSRMPKALAATILVQEQLGFALNRAGQRDEAERVLRALIAARGPSSETYGLLGRVFKDRWEEAAKANRVAPAAGWLNKAIDAYLKGFESDWRDAYPGINAVTLMEMREPPDPRRLELLPVVTYAVERKVATGEPDYWDHATLLELAILRGDRAKAQAALADALANVREAFEPETTARNLGLIRGVREQRGEDAAWIGDIEAELLRPRS